MGNTIKNYERKKRREQNEARREIRKIVHDAMIERFGYPREFKEKREENI